MKIFALDCAAVSASAALTDAEVLLGESFTNVKLTHSQTLLPMAESLLENSRANLSDVDVFAVTVGPGSFTGVRIGVAALKGMADAAEKPCFGVSALEAAAYPFRNFDGIVCAVMDARCEQVYTASFSGIERLTEDAAMKITELADLLSEYNRPVLLTGDGAQKVADTLGAACRFPIAAAPAQMRYPRASSAAYLAYEKIQKGEPVVSSKALQPLYLRLPQAQRELNNKQKINKIGE